MKQIKFNEPKVLKALLEKTKTSTLRKAWKNCVCASYWNMNSKLENPCRICDKKGQIEKPCKYEAGEEVELVWTGNDNDSIDSFVKKGQIIGKVKITSIRKIFAWNGNDAPLFDGFSLREFYALNDREGFNRGPNGKCTEFFNWLHKYADGFDTKKPFWLIRWDYI